jgi:hypothetical protein
VQTSSTVQQYSRSNQEPWSASSWVWFRLIWLFGKGHPAIVLENLALRQQLAIYQRKPQRPRIAGRDRWFWIALSVVWRN